jgi:hypothetical protein
VRQTVLGGLAHSFVRGIAELLAHELVLPVACFVLVIGHEAGYNERHCVLRVGCRYRDGRDDEVCHVDQCVFPEWIVFDGLLTVF